MRLRVRFAKVGKIRFTSHRDVNRIWERALRRAGVPVAYSQGFTPRPRIAFGLALPTGYESDAEYLDIDLDDTEGASVTLAALPQTLTGATPTGMTVLAVARIDRAEPSLQQSVTSCTWGIDVGGIDAATVSAAATRALAADEIVVTRERKGRMVTDDIRPQLVSLDVSEPTADGVRLTAELGTQPRAVRPAELLAAFDPSPCELRVRRLHQWIRVESERREPLEAPLSATGRAVPAALAMNAKDHRDDRPTGRRCESLPPGQLASRKIRQIQPQFIGS